MSEVEPRPDHLTHMPKLICAKLLSITSCSQQSLSTPTSYLSHLKSICDELGLLPKRDIEHKINLLDPNVPI